MSESTFPSVVQFLANATNLAEVDAALDLIAGRSTALDIERMDSITEGQEVTTANVTQGRFNGLSGTVVEVARENTLKPTALVRLDEDSTRKLRSYGADPIAPDATSYQQRLPLACLFPR